MTEGLKEKISNSEKLDFFRDKVGKVFVRGKWGDPEREIIRIVAIDESRRVVKVNLLDEKGAIEGGEDMETDELKEIIEESEPAFEISPETFFRFGKYADALFEKGIKRRQIEVVEKAIDKIVREELGKGALLDRADVVLLIENILTEEIGIDGGEERAEIFKEVVRQMSKDGENFWVKLDKKEFSDKESLAKAKEQIDRKVQEVLREIDKGTFDALIDKRGQEYMDDAFPFVDFQDLEKYNEGVRDEIAQHIEVSNKRIIVYFEKRKEQVMNQERDESVDISGSREDLEAKEALEDVVDFAKEHLSQVETGSDWNGYDREDKQEMLRVLVKKFIKEYVKEFYFVKSGTQEEADKKMADFVNRAIEAVFKK